MIEKDGLPNGGSAARDAVKGISHLGGAAVREAGRTTSDILPPEHTPHTTRLRGLRSFFLTILSVVVAVAVVLIIRGYPELGSKPKPGFDDAPKPAPLACSKEPCVQMLANWSPLREPHPLLLPTGFPDSDGKPEYAVTVRPVFALPREWPTPRYLVISEFTDSYHVKYSKVCFVEDFDLSLDNVTPVARVLSSGPPDDAEELGIDPKPFIQRWAYEDDSSYEWKGAGKVFVKVTCLGSHPCNDYKSLVLEVRAAGTC